MLLVWNKIGQADRRKAEETMQTARAALEQGDIEKALSLASLARDRLEAAQATEAEGQAAILVAQILESLEQHETAIENYVHAAAKLENPVSAGAALVQAAEIDIAQGQFDNALTRLKQARSAFRRAHDADSLLKTVCRVAYVYYEQEKWSEAEAWYREALALAEEQGSLELQDTINLELGNVVAMQERFEEARALFEVGVAHARATDDKSALAGALHGLAVTFVAEGNVEPARALFQETLELKRELGDEIGAAHTLYEMGVMMAMVEQCDEARTLLAWSVEMYEQEAAPEVEVARATWNSYALSC